MAAAGPSRFRRCWRAGFACCGSTCGHGGSDPVSGDYTMAALADDVAAALAALGIARVHYLGLSIGGMIGQAFALAHGECLISAMWCDTLPESPKGADEIWAQRLSTVRNAGSLAPL